MHHQVLEAFKCETFYFPSNPLHAYNLSNMKTVPVKQRLISHTIRLLWSTLGGEELFHRCIVGVRG